MVAKTLDQRNDCHSAVMAKAKEVMVVKEVAVKMMDLNCRRLASS